MTQYLETCPIKEVFQVINYTPKHQLNLPSYQPPATCLENLSAFQPLNYDKKRPSSNNHPSSTLLKPKKYYNQTQQRKPLLKIIPSNKSYLKENLKNKPNQILKIQTHKFGKDKRSHSYIPKSQISNLDLGPGKYHNDHAFKVFNDAKNFHRLPQLKKEQFRRRIHSQQIMARSLPVPGVGQYNIQNTPIVKLNCHSTKFQPHPSDAEVEKIRQKLKNIKDRSPSPSSYNALPRSYSLFSTFKQKQREKHMFQAYNRQVKVKEQLMKMNGKGKNLSAVGPGKYLTLDDWKQKLNDRNIMNFVTRPQIPSVYL